MKKICIDARYIFPKMDGIGRYLYNLIDQLSVITVDDNNFHFVIFEVDEFSEKSILRNFDHRKNISFVKVPIKPQTVKNHFINKYLTENEIDLYHYAQFDLPWFISGVKIVTSIMDMNPQKLKYFFPTKLGWIKRYYSIITNWVALKKSDLIITISKSTKDDLVDFFNYKYPEKIKTVHLGVDEKLFQNKDKEKLNCQLESLQKKYNINRYFLYVGNNRPHKNLQRVLQAFSSLLNNSKEDLQFLLVGRHLENNSDVKTIVSNLNLEDRVISTELDDDELAAAYFGAEAFIFCSLSEGFGLPVLEAMAHGTPVLTSNLSSMKEIAEGAALLVNPYSINGIEQGLTLILQDSNYRKEISHKGLERAKLFTWRKCAEETLLIYNELLDIYSPNSI